MERRKFRREFKLEAVNLVSTRGVAIAEAVPDLDINHNVLRRWAKLSADPKRAFPGQGQMKPEQVDIKRLQKEVAKPKADRDILKKATAYSAREVDGRRANG